MARLYEINQQILDIYDNAEIDENGEMHIDEQLLLYLEHDRDAKIEGLIKYYKDMQGDIEKFKAEIKSLAESKRVLENKSDSLERFLDTLHKGEAKQYGVHKVSYRKSTVLIGNDIDILPPELKNTVVEPKKADIKAKLKEGVEITGWSLLDKKNIQIK
jgi:hypothetical protein